MQLYLDDYRDVTIDVPDGVPNTLIKCRPVYDSLDWTYHIGYFNILKFPLFEKRRTVTLAHCFRELSKLCLVDKQFNHLINESSDLKRLRCYYFALLDNWYGILPCGPIWTDIDERHLNVIRMYLECSDSYINWMWEQVLTSDEYDREDYQDLLHSINHTDYSLFLFEKRKMYIGKRNTFKNIEKLPISLNILLLSSND